MKKNHSGFTLIELIIVIAVGSIMAVFALQDRIWEVRQLNAKKLGVQVYEYNNAVREFIADNPGVNGNFIGVDWLKSAAECGAPAVAADSYLDCNFQNVTSLGKLTFNTNIVTLGGVTRGTTIMPPLLVDGNPRPDLSGLAVMVASGGAMTAYTSPPAAAPGDLSFRSNINTAVITMQAGSVPSTDVWLRTDGSNDMEANIVFDPANPANIREINNVSALSNLLGNSIRLRNDLIAEANVQVNGTLSVNGLITGNNSLQIADNINTTGGSITAATELNSGTDATIGRDLDVTRNTVLGGTTLSRGVFTAENGIEVTAGDLNVANNASVTGGVTVGTFRSLGQARIDGVLDVRNDVLISNNLTVGGDSGFNGVTDFNGVTNFNEDVNLTAGAGEVFVNADRVIITDRGGQRLSNLLPNQVIKDTYVVTDNQLITKSSCPNGGTSKIFIIPASVRMVAYVDGTWPLEGDAFLEARAVSSGANWRIVIKTYDSAGNPISAGQGIAMTSCFYS